MPIKNLPSLSKSPDLSDDRMDNIPKLSGIGLFRQYHQIELFGKELSYEYYKKINSTSNPILSRLLASAIPLSSLLSLVTKLLSDFCRMIDTIIESLRTGEFAIGNIQTYLVDFVEYGRHLMGVFWGLFVAWYSPTLAAKSFLMNPADPSIQFLDKKEAAHLYSMADLLHQFFIKYNIDYRICCGTALGAKREGGIIRNDDDIDLMLHPDSVEPFRALINSNVFTQETGIDITHQPWTGGFQCFFPDSPKGLKGSPLEKIGKPFVDIFPGTWREKGEEEVITYGEDRMYNMSRDDYFTKEEWEESPALYNFGPTKLRGVQAIESYLVRAYGALALQYVAVLYPHDTYSSIYATPLEAFSIFAEHAAPCYMRHEQPAPLQWDDEEFRTRTSGAVDNNLSNDQLSDISLAVLKPLT